MEAKLTRNIKVYYLLTFMGESWFIAGNWLYFWLKYMTGGELGLLDAVAFGVALLMEIPSGAIADLLGKRKTIILARFLAFVGISLMAAAHDKWALLVGNLILLSGLAFYSGSIEAIVYDSLLQTKHADKYDSVIARGSSLGLITTVTATLFGGVLYSINERLPWIAWAVFIFGTFVVSWWLVEPDVDSEKFTIKNYLKQIYYGSRELTQTALRPFLLLITLVGGLYFAYSFGFIKPGIAISMGIDASGQSVLFALAELTTAIVLSRLHWLRKIVGDRYGVFLVAFGFAVGLFMAASGYGVAMATLAVILITVSGNLNNNWGSVIVNEVVSSKYRATAISTLALIYKLPYVLIALLAGGALENNQLGQLLTILLVLIGCGVIVQWLLARTVNNKLK